MKLSIWQQFSSNHSNSFTLVGVFPSAAKAEKAFKRIDTLLKAIDTWREKHPDDYTYELMSEPEEKIAEQYDIDWGDPTENVRIQQYRHIIEIDAPADSWTRRRPYEVLLQAFGGDVAGWDGQDQGDEISEARIFRAEITAKASSDSDASTLALALAEMLKTENAKEFDIYQKASVRSEGSEIRIENLSLRRIQFFAAVVADLEAVCRDVRYRLQKYALDDEEM
jgi:hypothetical protein